MGLALGDAFGAPFEGGVLERLLWRAIGRTRGGKRRWTDDTRMSLDLAESLIAHGDLVPDDVATRFASSYRWSRGYGPGAARLLKQIRRGRPWRDANRRVFSEGSFGNGGAMRAPVIGLFYAGDGDSLAEKATAATEITHAHPLGVAGARAIATATARALEGSDPLTILATAAEQCRSEPHSAKLRVAMRWLSRSQTPTPREVREELGNGVASLESCPTALYCAARFLRSSFEELLAFVIDCRGDVDTIAAMAGAIWGAAHSAERLPQDLLGELEDRQRIEKTASRLLERRSGVRQPSGPGTADPRA